MTKQEAIKNHRKMWNWIADQIEKTGKMVSKNDYFDHIGMPVKERPSIDCFCCEYAKTKKGIHNCNLCPVKWPNEVGSKKSNTYCYIPNNPYRKFINIVWSPYIPKIACAIYYKQAAKLARQIANLPEREEE